jgi:hypothetical protein
MSSSGLIYMAILGAWAVYLVSRCLRSPGAQPDTRSAPTDGAVLRRRGRRDAGPGYSMLRPRPADAAAPVVKRRLADLGPRGGRPVGVGVPAPALPQRRPISRATARRRRRMLSLLSLAVAATSTVASVALLPSWAPGVPALLLVTYLVELRAQARRAQAPLVRVAKPPVVANTEAAHVGPVRRALRITTSAPFVDPWPSFEVEPAGEKKSACWEPVPVPVPTYLKVARPATVPEFTGRRIDVSAGRLWVSSSIEDTQEIPAVPAAAEPAEASVPGRELEVAAASEVAEAVEELPQKRAVNE